MNDRRLKATLVSIAIVLLTGMMQRSHDATAYASGLVSVSAETTVANIPNAFSYQGTLRRANGDLANGTFNITLQIYPVVTGGTALHSETFPNVVVRNGNFSVVVGDATALPAGLFDNANLYIGLTVAPDAEMLPRQRLFPVPWAMQADAAKSAVSAQTANQLLNNTATNLILNRGSNNGAALAISSSAASYGAGMTMANSTGNATFGMYVGSDGAWHFYNTGGNQELLKFNNGDKNAYFTGKVHAAGFNGMCFTWPLVVTEFYQIYCNQDIAETFATDQRSEPGDLMVLIPEDGAARPLRDRDVPAVRLATQSNQEALVGVVNGSNLSIESEKSALTVSERPVQRQFRLVTTSVTNNGAELNGEYRETLWGYTSAPITVIGAFTLQRAGANAITPVLAPTDPNVVADTATTTQGTAVTIPVLRNDSAANGWTLTITAVGKPQFGTATTDGQTVTYTPNATFVGNDSFSYFVSDGKGGTAAASVTVTVNGPGGPNQAPTAANDNVGTTSDTAVTINVLGNDSDPNGDALLITIDSQPQHGTAVVQNGQIIYTPAAGYTGTDSFTYIISDGKGGTAAATVTVTVGGQDGGRTIYLPVIQR